MAGKTINTKKCIFALHFCCFDIKKPLFLQLLRFWHISCAVECRVDDMNADLEVV
jgi:hypothetical protein